nr:PREDICTED: uncharacterized protein LOC105675229 [Linepithema humile]
MSTKLLQANLNHARWAQDLFLADLCERDAGLGVAAEPYRVLDSNSNWVSASNGFVVIVRGHSPRSPPPPYPCETGSGIRCGAVGCLLRGGGLRPTKAASPQISGAAAGNGEGIRRCLFHPVLVAGDFNAWAQTWGSRYTNSRDQAVLDWAAELDLLLLNRGSENTYVYPRGESIVDLTWASPRAAHLVGTWRVADRESLSDHLYIEMVLTATSPPPRPEVLIRRHQQRGDKPPRRWALARLDQDKLVAAALVETWSDPPDLVDIEADAEEIGNMAERICDAAMPRSKPAPRRAIYWWTEEITDLRRRVNAARRDLLRARRRAGRENDSTGGSPPWSGDLEISERELSEAPKRLGATGKASGPDGVPGRAWALAFGVVGARLRRMYNTCLRTGAFPSLWKRANLVLLRKKGKPAEQPSAYRPICLLDEVGKLFEKIIAGRIVQHLSQDVPNLLEDQFGFREGRSTTDAITHLRALSDQIVGEGDVALAVSLDIVNAFNSLPWEHVRP